MSAADAVAPDRHGHATIRATAQERREVQGGVPSGVPVILVEEPGKAPAVYEAASTVIYVLGHHPLP